MRTVPAWDESTKELRISLYKHPVNPNAINDAYAAAKKTHGTVKSVAVFVMRGMGDSQSIKVLRSRGFTKNETRSTAHGVCYTQSALKPDPKPKVEEKPEPQTDWLTEELRITTDAIEARRALGVHETFLTGLLREQAEQQKMVDEQRAARDAVKDTAEYQELCRQERELQKEIDALRGTCQS
jgi:hypothetical protein